MSFSFLGLFLWILQAVGWFLVSILFIVWWGQSYILYLPTVGGRAGVRRKLSFNSYTSRSPAEQSLKYDEYFLTAADQVLIHTWLIPHPTMRATAPTLIFFHGNAGNIGNRIFNAQQLISDCDVNVFLVEYRGFGNSTGSPSEHGFHLDALCALDFLRSRRDLDTSKIFLFGRSLGGAVATWLASQRPQHIAGLIVENTFTSVEDMAISMARNIAPLQPLLEKPTFLKCFRTFLYIFMTSHWRSLDLVKSIQRPTMLVSGLSDELIPPAQMNQLWEALPDTVYRHFHKVERGTHNDTYIKGGAQYFIEVKKFLHAVCEAPNSTPSPAAVLTED